MDGQRLNKCTEAYIVHLLAHDRLDCFTVVVNFRRRCIRQGKTQRGQVQRVACLPDDLTRCVSSIPAFGEEPRRAGRLGCRVKAYALELGERAEHDSTVVVKHFPSGLLLLVRRIERTRQRQDNAPLGHLG